MIPAVVSQSPLDPGKRLSYLQVGRTQSLTPVRKRRWSLAPGVIVNTALSTNACEPTVVWHTFRLLHLPERSTGDRIRATTEASCTSAEADPTRS